LGENATKNPGRAGTSAGYTRRLPATERRAVEILEAKDSWSKPEIRKAYKALIKILHPDMNGGDRSQEEQLQQVMWAWDQIKDSRNFK
jgi:DnaJ-class molecular chaperone